MDCFFRVTLTEEKKRSCFSSKDGYCEKNKEKLNNLPKFETAKENDEEDISNVPKRVQDNLKELISQFADGIWAKDLPGHYQ